jgi:hypothetical protein
MRGNRLRCTAATQFLDDECTKLNQLGNPDRLFTRVVRSCLSTVRYGTMIRTSIEPIFFLLSKTAHLPNAIETHSLQ